MQVQTMSHPIKIIIESGDDTETAVKLQDVLYVLNSIQNSYSNYLEIEAKKSPLLNVGQKVSQKIIESLKKRFTLYFQDISFGSFIATMNPIFNNESGNILNETDKWGFMAYEFYQHEILVQDFSDDKFIEQMSIKYSGSERKTFLTPLIKITNRSKSCKVSIYDSVKNKSHYLVKPSVEVLNTLFPETKKNIEPLENKIIQIVMEVKGDYNPTNISRKKIRNVLFQEELLYETYPYKPDTIQYDGRTFILNRKLNCTVDYKDGLFFILCEEFNISVWEETRKKAIEAFGFCFYSLYLNYYLEKDERLSSDAVLLKNQLQRVIRGINEN
jgi:hypothetical protein